MPVLASPVWIVKKTNKKTEPVGHVGGEVTLGMSGELFDV